MLLKAILVDGIKYPIPTPTSMAIKIQRVKYLSKNASLLFIFGLIR
jgi:hypothetical protein